MEQHPELSNNGFNKSFVEEVSQKKSDLEGLLLHPIHLN